MDRQGWYLIAYDVSEDPRRQRVFRCLRRRALSLQRSVFLANCTRAALKALLDEVAALIEPDDDLRAYPIGHPGDLWLHGQVPLQGNLILPGRGASRADRQTPPPPRGILRGLFSLLGVKRDD